MTNTNDQLINFLKIPHPTFSEILLYTKPNGHVKAEIYLRNATKNG